MSAGPAFDLDAYLARIGCSGGASVTEVHSAHATAIPFENLDPHRGVAVSLDSADLQRKLVAERRGGYCFEQNLLLRAALQACGYQVDTYLARVRYRAREGVVRPRGHLVLKVQTDSGAMHADVGFGRGTPLEPLRWGAGSEHDCGGWSYRVVQDGPELVLQQLEQTEWVDLYGFVPEAVPMVDVETINWWTCTHPASPFVTGLIAATQDAAGTRTAVSDWDSLCLTESTAEGSVVKALALDEVPALLAERFGLPGFALGADGRIVRT